MIIIMIDLTAALFIIILLFVSGFEFGIEIVGLLIISSFVECGASRGGEKGLAGDEDGEFKRKQG